jgi:hypothetical protein
VFSGDVEQDPVCERGSEGRLLAVLDGLEPLLVSSFDGLFRDGGADGGNIAGYETAVCGRLQGSAVPAPCDADDAPVAFADGITLAVVDCGFGFGTETDVHDVLVEVVFVACGEHRSEH